MSALFVMPDEPRYLVFFEKNLLLVAEFQACGVNEKTVELFPRLSLRG